MKAQRGAVIAPGGFPLPEHLRGEHPPLAWNVVHEAARLVDLSAAQIRLALLDGDKQMSALSDAFVALAGRLQLRLGGGHEDAELLAELQRAMVAIQFYDRMSQRLEHAGGSLEGLSELLLDERRYAEPLSWGALHERIKSSYSTREEVELFAAAEAGASGAALIHDARSGSGDDDDDDIEFF